MPDRPTLLVDLPTFERTLNAQGLLNSQERAIVRSLADGVTVAEACRQAGWTGELSLQCLAILRAFGIEPMGDGRQGRDLDPESGLPWKDLSEIERMIVQHIGRGSTWRQACRKAGAPESMIKAGASRYPRIIRYLHWIMRKHGITDDRVFRGYSKKFDAKKKVFFPTLAYQHPDTKEVVIPERIVEDNAIQLDAEKYYCKLKRYEPTRAEEEEVEEKPEQPTQRVLILLESATPPEGGRVDRFIVEKEERR